MTEPSRSREHSRLPGRKSSGRRHRPKTTQSSRSALVEEAQTAALSEAPGLTTPARTRCPMKGQPLPACARNRAAPFQWPRASLLARPILLGSYAMVDSPRWHSALFFPLRENDYRPPLKATRTERTLRIGHLMHSIFSRNAQTDVPGLDRDA